MVFYPAELSVRSDLMYLLLIIYINMLIYQYEIWQK